MDAHRRDGLIWNRSEQIDLIALCLFTVQEEDIARDREAFA